jgi:hypothetical protein
MNDDGLAILLGVLVNVVALFLLLDMLSWARGGESLFAYFWDILAMVHLQGY